ncbi:hypothetical protein GQX73_g7863 [Xylaria multiplex]|uniref:Protein kinase domain-containing protein n=1 Tax=Xylaria multiplex TaxID=323545 RepID=A0A7C8IN08_9PEZI|nr:hypothetical protein GQX73_g7863 [Xylaria multiplex]
MAYEVPDVGSEPKPKLISINYAHGHYYASLVCQYMYHGCRFDVLASSKDEDHPEGYDFSQSIEGKLLLEYEDLSYGTFTEEKDQKMNEVANNLTTLVSNACFSLMRKTAPPVPLPEPRTLDEELYPPTYALQVLTKGDQLSSHPIDFKGPELVPPISEQQFRALGIETAIYRPSEVTLISCMKGLVWKVEVGGETMICKVSKNDVFGPTLANELEVYQKISQLGNGSKFPKMKGAVKSHTGVIAILLSYIPHRHHNLFTILEDTKTGLLPKTEATAAMRTKWAEQIRRSVTQLHELGILWLDTKTDNVLIDDEGNAIVLDFGGGNTVGWVDEDKYGTLEGETQGLEKIMAALRDE